MTVRGERWRDVMDGGRRRRGGRREKCGNDGGEGHVHQSSLTGVRYGDRKCAALICTPPYATNCNARSVVFVLTKKKPAHIQVIQNKLLA